MTPGKLEVSIKFNQLPEPSTIKDGWKEITIDCDGKPVFFTLRPKLWNKLTDAAKNWPLWVAAVSGQMGPTRGTGFVLLEPNLQVFERKQKPAAEAAAAPAS